jgi:hypothetical protein
VLQIKYLNILERKFFERLKTISPTFQLALFQVYGFSVNSLNFFLYYYPILSSICSDSFVNPHLSSLPLGPSFLQPQAWV